jgi:hypothetical protein
MSKRGRSLGMKITHPSDLFYMSPPIWNTSKLEKFFREMKDHGNGLVVVVIPDQGDTYGKGQIEFINKLANKRPTLNRRFKFDDNQAQYLIRMIFSSHPDIRASAKLNLTARLENGIYAEVMNDPETVLEIVCAEAQLTQREVLSILFPKSDKGEDRLCIACGKPGRLGKVIYHHKCPVIKWLVTKCHFSYSDEEQALSEEGFAYLTPLQRNRIARLLDYHARLTRDIVVKTESGTSIWHSQTDGELKRVDVMNRKLAREEVAYYATSMMWLRLIDVKHKQGNKALTREEKELQKAAADIEFNIPQPLYAYLGQIGSYTDSMGKETELEIPCTTNNCSSRTRQLPCR